MASSALASAAAAAQQKLQMIKGERHLFSSSDDNIVMKQTLETHSPDGREVDVRSLLRLIEDIMQRANPTVLVTPQTHMEVLEDRAHHAAVIGMLEALAYPIHRIAAEITYKCTSGGDAHATTIALLHSLSSYAWDAKVTLALAAFAVLYGEFWLTAQLHTVNPLAKSVSLLKQLPDIIEHSHLLKPRFDAINNLIKAMLDVTKCIVELKELPSEYISLESPDMSMAIAHIPTAVYWTIRSVVACSSQIIMLIGLGHEYISATTEAWELSSLTHKVNNIHGHLTKQLDRCHQHIDERRHVEAYQTLVRLFEVIHIDNSKILRALMSSKDEHPLFDGTSKKRFGVDILRRRIVMLFISDLDIPQEELLILVQLYHDSHQGKLERPYEIVWLPVTERHGPWNRDHEENFNRLASMMPWYLLHHPSLLDRAVIQYIREVWHFEKKPLLAVLDPQGKVTNRNALHMMWIWGTLAFPFTTNREAALWNEETWRLEFLVDEIDPMILTWVREGRYVCLYGGEDIDWIRRFTTVLRRVAHEAKIPLDMVYVGKSSSKERVKKAVAAIAAEKLSSSWQDPVMVWFFWVRLESMWHSKMQHGKSIDNDSIMQEVMTLLSFDGSDEGWAIISRGSLEMVKSQGKKLVECLNQFEQWKATVETEGFIPALTNALLPYHTHEHCTRLILPGENGRIQEHVICAECRRPMEKFILYRCCND
ncbi:protein SIEVE ELEMENT OCCLUSION B [Elaeis guineensis]|uniref:Protein SIEVE ELEMENT OCCLUSION B n=1 Tax=Elaeis guineensis var. tenera TaxID=51953 RepID=A0A6I9Q7E2_ELAGV|nr:protein SIEVE ELEMENT OCCLUSION B [Elaeis guineensis]